MTKKQVKAIMSKKSDHWRTPTQLINRISFNLDPCPYKSKTMDGLEINWNGVIFCNPPYSNIKEWVKKKFI